ncbi:hypothetical protein E4T39_04188 [Aureobasidium subglaciale]|nr:hypothetical protein E4T39_04188 [Aureobasidium subglaciale]
MVQVRGLNHRYLAPHVLSKGSKWSSASALTLFEGCVHNHQALKPTLQRFLRSEKLVSHMQQLGLQVASLLIASNQGQIFTKVLSPHSFDVRVYTNCAVIYHVLHLQIQKLQSCSGQRSGCDRCREKDLECVYEESSTRTKRKLATQARNLASPSGDIMASNMGDLNGQPALGTAEWNQSSEGQSPNRGMNELGLGIGSLTDFSVPPSIMPGADNNHDREGFDPNNMGASSPGSFDFESYFNTSELGSGDDFLNTYDLDGMEMHSLLPQDEPFPFAAEICGQPMRSPKELETYDPNRLQALEYKPESCATGRNERDVSSNTSVGEAPPVSTREGPYSPSSTEASSSYASHTRSLRSLTSRSSVSSVSPCDCMTQSASLLEELEVIMTQGLTQPDHSLKVHRQAMSYTTDILDCTVCRKSHSLIALLILVATRLVGIISPMCETASTNTQLKLGDYDVDPHDEWPELARCLITMQLEKLRDVLRRLWSVSDGPSYDMHREMLSRACDGFRECWIDLKG